MKQLMTTLLLAAALAACSNDPAPAAATANNAADPAPTSRETSIYAEALASPTRLEGDAARDAGRKPDEVLAFLGIGPGDVVLDLFAVAVITPKLSRTWLGRTAGSWRNRTSPT